MSLGPQALHHQLENEIQKRISHESPTKYDLDFYQRKITRLQNDLNEVQDQLSRARVRLRRAEDFEIKYELLLKQNSNLLSENQQKQKQYCSLKAEHQLLKVKLDDRHSKVQDFSEQKASLLNQIEKWKGKHAQSEQQRKQQGQKLSEHLETNIKKFNDAAKKEFIEKQDNYQEQIRQLKKQLYEKETVENIVGSKVDRIRQDKDEEIKRLNRNIQNRKEEFEEAIRGKDAEIEKLRQKFEKVFNFEIENIKQSLDDQDELFNIEINGLRELLGLKNQEISKLLSEVRSQNNSHTQQREQLTKDINSLREKIYQIQRQNEMQLYNVKERLSKIHSLEIQAIENRYSELLTALKNEKNELERVLKEREKLIEAEKKDMERIKEEMMDRLKERQARITQLQDRIKETGDMNANQMKTLHQSFHEIETQKQNLTSQYQNNIGFLNQQISKLNNANELKNKQLRGLHEEVSNLKKMHAETVKDLQDRWKEERKERELERQRQRDKRQKILEEQRTKQRDWRHRQRQLQRARENEQRQKNKLQYTVEQLEKDIERLNKYNKQLDDTLKRQFKKNQMSTLDAGGVRRELTSELERQKAELEAIKRMEVDQIKKKYEVELVRLTNQKEKLETDLLKKQIAYNELEGEFKKLEYINKNIEKINKEKLAEYHKKMATLNNEINLTQNLYEAFMKSKAKENYGQSSP